MFLNSSLSKSKYLLGECDKNMGMFLDGKESVYKAVFDIFCEPTFRRINIKESYLSESMYNKTNNFMAPFRHIWEKDYNYELYRFKMINIYKSNNWLKLPNLRPMKKVHKSYPDWRRTINMSAWYTSYPSSFVSEILNELIVVFEEKSEIYSILENSNEIINELNEHNTLNNNHNKSFINIVGDIKALYDSVLISQCIDAINFIKQYLNISGNKKLEFIINFIIFTKNNTFIKYKNQIVQIIDGLITGYSHSGSLANVTLMVIEYKNMDIFISEYKKLNQSEFTEILIRKRYIDDIYILLAFFTDKFDLNSINLFASKLEDVINNNIYPINIKLISKHGYHNEFLDIMIDIIANNNLHTSIYEKPNNKFIYLHYQSNNPLDHKKSIWISSIFRSICINDALWKHKKFIRNMYNRLINRGYHPSVLRIFNKSSNIPSYKDRNKYLLKSYKKLKIKKYNILIKFLKDNYIEDEYFISNNRLDEIINELNEYESNKPINEEKIIYFKKTYQQLFDNDRRLRKILFDFYDNLNNILPVSNPLRIVLCNKVTSKISAFID